MYGKMVNGTSINKYKGGLGVVTMTNDQIIESIIVYNLSINPCLGLKAEGKLDYWSCGRVSLTSDGLTGYVRYNDQVLGNSLKDAVQKAVNLYETTQI